MSKTNEALKILIKGEMEASFFYKECGVIARKEGYIKIADLFNALVVAESIHIKNHLNALGEEYKPEIEERAPGISTLENLNSALKGEVKENKELYPKLINSIKGECSDTYGKVARLSMTWAQKAEKVHAKILKMAIKSLKQGFDLPINSIYYCEVCGNLELDRKGNKECSVCGHDSIFFKKYKGEK